MEHCATGAHGGFLDSMDKMLRPGLDSTGEKGNVTLMSPEGVMRLRMKLLAALETPCHSEQFTAHVPEEKININ